MGRMTKTTKEYCISCKYHYGGGNGPSGIGSHTMVFCDYFLKTGKRRGCPVGKCDKWEQYEKGEKVIPWDEELLETSELMN